MAKQKKTEEIIDIEETKQEVLLQEDFDELQEKFEEVEGQLKRAVADYHNLERRVNEGHSQLSSWASASLIQKLLPTLDNLELVVELGGDNLADKPETKDWYRGVQLAVNQLKQILKEEGLEEIVADGQFDPILHEAVDTGDGDEGAILKVAQRGYTLGGKVLRPAKVVVGRKEK